MALQPVAPAAAPPSAAPSAEHAAGGQEMPRANSLIDRAGSSLKSAGSNLSLQRANTLPTEDKELRHAATMPMTFDVDSERPCCGGLWKCQQFAGFVLGLSLFVLLIIVRPVGIYPHANSMLGFTLLCACFWIFEVMPVYLTALLPMVFIPFMQVASSEYIASAYWNWISMLVVGVYLMDIALEHVHLPRRMALALLLKVGLVSPGVLLACFMGLCWLLAMFLNSIAVTLVVTPFAISLMNAAEDQARAGAEERAPEEGAVEGPGAEGQREARKVQKLADGILLGIAYSASAGGIATLTGAIPNYFLAAESMVARHVSWLSWFAFAFPISLVTGILAYAVLYIRYVSRLNFPGISRQVLEQEYEELVSEVGPVSRDEVLVGALQVLQVVLLIARRFSIAKWFTSPYGEELVNDATLALLPALLLFIIPSQSRPGQSLLTWPVVHEKFDFGLLLLIGGSIAINYGFTNSGLSVALGEAVGSLIPRVHPFTLNLVVVLSVTMCSQVLSSISTASTMLPVLAAASVDAMVNPLTLMLPATIATSFAFLLPTATPPNVVVLAKSQELGRSLRFRDFFTNGLVLMFVCVVVGAALSAGMARLVFVDDDTLPQWACEALPARCLWVNVEGIVRGVAVSSQACIVDLATSGETCRLWNGDLVLTSMTMGVPEM
mmetsp:Transcript_125807/g.363968  ORF Transcript_125807/g.363968 Transcript_125807/m.363968 type:complete len:666 (-) Transcript_125807:374-2371(-)